MKKEIIGLIVTLLGLVATYPTLKASIQEIITDIIWLLGQLG